MPDILVVSGSGPLFPVLNPFRAFKKDTEEVDNNKGADLHPSITIAVTWAYFPISTLLMFTTSEQTEIHILCKYPVYYRYANPF